MKSLKKYITLITLGVLLGSTFLGYIGLSAALTFTTTEDNNWGAGFCYQFDIQNTSENPITNWVIGVGITGGVITSSWGGVYTDVGGGNYEITSPGAFIDTINPGQIHSLGFCGNAGSVTTVPYLISFTNIGGGSLQDYTVEQGGLRVDITTQNSWSSGYCRDIILTNTGTSDIESWEIQFELDQALDNSSSGNFSRSGNTYTITPLVWNSTLTPGSITNLNYCTTGSNVDSNWNIISPASLMTTNSGNQIGTGSILGAPSRDMAIYWDQNFPGYGSGSVEDILIRARVLPSLNMQISAEEIDLGTLLAGVTSTGSLAIEIGTNAVNGVTITARSQSGGLTNVADNAIQINDLSADGVAESYTWTSTPNAVDDSSYTGFSASGLTELEVNTTTTEHVVYDTNRPESTNGVDDVVFTVSATAEAETPAGEYEDRVTFTVTGSF